MSTPACTRCRKELPAALVADLDRHGGVVCPSCGTALRRRRKSEARLPVDPAVAPPLPPATKAAEGDEGHNWFKATRHRPPTAEELTSASPQSAWAATLMSQPSTEPPRNDVRPPSPPPPKSPAPPPSPPSRVTLARAAPLGAGPGPAAAVAAAAPAPQVVATAAAMIAPAPAPPAPALAVVPRPAPQPAVAPPRPTPAAADPAAAASPDPWVDRLTPPSVTMVAEPPSGPARDRPPPIAVATESLPTPPAPMPAVPSAAPPLLRSDPTRASLRRLARLAAGPLQSRPVAIAAGAAVVLVAGAILLPKTNRPLARPLSAPAIPAVVARKAPVPPPVAPAPSRPEVVPLPPPSAPAAAAPAPEPPPVVEPPPAPEPPPVVERAPAPAHRRVAKGAERAPARAATTPRRLRKVARRSAVDKRAPGPSAGSASDSREAYERGNTSLLSADVTGAIAAYQEAVRLAPADPAGYRGLGLAYAQKGETAAAIRSLRKYLKLAPSAPDSALISRRIELLSRAGHQ